MQILKSSGNWVFLLVAEASLIAIHQTSGIELQNVLITLIITVDELLALRRWSHELLRVSAWEQRLMLLLMTSSMGLKVDMTFGNCWTQVGVKGRLTLILRTERNQLLFWVSYIIMYGQLSCVYTWVDRWMQIPQAITWWHVETTHDECCALLQQSLLRMSQRCALMFLFSKLFQLLLQDQIVSLWTK